MGKFEKEIKILNVDLETTKSRLMDLGAEYRGVKNQKLYTYDVPCINIRFLEIKQLLECDNPLMLKTCLNKLRLVFDEFCDLIDDVVLVQIYNQLEIKSFNELFKLDKIELLNKLNNKLLNDSINEYGINPNKWVRLRKNNDNIELTVKHIYKKNNDDIQKVSEVEIQVSDFEEANLLLNSLGIFKRNFQEKIRYSYKYKTACIEIDIWPMLEPYIEIECDDEDLISDIVKKLGFSNKEIVSLNTEELYKRIGVDVLSIDTLSF